MSEKSFLNVPRAPDVCYYCGVQHKNVEAGGIHHCPNVLCQGPGAGDWRSKLKSYQETGRDGRHTVDHWEAIAAGLAAATKLESEGEERLALHIRGSVEKWLPKAASDVPNGAA